METDGVMEVFNPASDQLILVGGRHVVVSPAVHSELPFDVNTLRRNPTLKMRILTPMLAMMLTVGVSACKVGETPVQKASREGILLFGNDTEPQALDPHLITGYTEQKVLWSLFEGLVALDPETLEPIPGVAETWELSPDGTVYTFHLRQDAKWSNGDSVTSKDFAFAWERILTPKLGSEYSYMLHCIKGAKDFNEGKVTDFSTVGLDASDDHTLVVTLNNPTPYFLSMQVHFTFVPLNRASIEKVGAVDDRSNRWTLPENFVGNGPFKMTAWEPGRIIRTVRNEHYWDAKTVKLNGIDFYPSGSSLETEEKMFRSGDIHLTSDLLATKVEAYRNEKSPLLNIYPVCGVYFYRFNVTRKPLDDVRVRMALSLAIDREAIVTRISKGEEPVAFSFVPTDTAGYTSEHKLVGDVAAAKQLLAEAGYPDGAGMPPVEILFNSSENHKLIAEAIQQMWKDNLNVSVTLTNQEWGVYLSSLTQLNYGIARSAWYADVLDPINFLECFESDSGNNRTGWTNAQYDSLIDQARATVDPAERLAVLQKAEQVLLDESPIAPIYFYTKKFLMSPDVKNVHRNRLAYYNYKFVSVEPAQ